jgi:hypothetical protein
MTDSTLTFDNVTVKTALIESTAFLYLSFTNLVANNISFNSINQTYIYGDNAGIKIYNSTFKKSNAFEQ